MLHSWKRIAI